MPGRLHKLKTGDFIDSHHVVAVACVGSEVLVMGFSGKVLIAYTMPSDEEAVMLAEQLAEFVNKWG